MNSSIQARSRAWVFTVNNYTPEYETLLQHLDCQYIVYGREIGANFRAAWFNQPPDSPGDSSEDVQMSTQSSVGLIDELPILDFSYLMEED